MLVFGTWCLVVRVRALIVRVRALLYAYVPCCTRTCLNCTSASCILVRVCHRHCVIVQSNVRRRRAPRPDCDAPALLVACFLYTFLCGGCFFFSCMCARAFGNARAADATCLRGGGLPAVYVPVYMMCWFVGKCPLVCCSCVAVCTCLYHLPATK